MGWNALEEMSDHPLLRGLEVGAHMYFTHSYALFPSDPSNVIAQVDHGGRFSAAVAKASGLVCFARTIPSSVITFAGEKKCIPTTSPGRDVTTSLAPMSS